MSMNATTGDHLSAAKQTLGVALITRDAQQHLAACLHAVQFADDIVVLDSGSQDRTCEIAQAAGARLVVDTDWQGFGIQKNRAIALLKTDWILLIDADEVVSPQLANAIQSVVGSPSRETYSLDRLSCFCGKWIRHSGWRPDRVARLFRQGSAHFSDDRVHERLLVDGPVTALEGVLLHYSYDDISAVLRKLDSYSAAGARQRFERGNSAGFGKAVSRALWAFLRTYLLKRGFLDGQAGFMIATLNAQTVYYRFLRLAELHKDSMGGNRKPGEHLER